MNAPSLEETYGEFFHEGGNVPFDDQDVPGKLASIIPYARFWGIADDYDRHALADKAPKTIADDLLAITQAHAQQLDDWLASPEADWTNEAYLAFSNMRMAADYLSAKRVVLSDEEKTKRIREVLNAIERDENT
jgi:hypothetical protein